MPLHTDRPLSHSMDLSVDNVVYVVLFSSFRNSSNRTGSQMLSRSAHVPTRKTQDLKLAYSEFYLSLILLQNYQTLNFTGFRKILKKHDKVLVLLCCYLYYFRGYCCFSPLIEETSLSAKKIQFVFNFKLNDTLQCYINRPLDPYLIYFE